MSVYSIDNLKEVMGDDPDFIAVVVQPLVDEVDEVLQAVFIELRQDFNL